MMPIHEKIKCGNGFTIVELLVSSIILVTISCLFFAAMLSMAKLSNFSRNELEAYSSASAWLEQVRTGASSNTQYNNLSACGWTNVTNLLPSSDPSLWELAGRVDNLAGAYSVEDVDLGSGVLFKKISIKLTWDERQ